MSFSILQYRNQSSYWEQLLELLLESSAFWVIIIVLATILILRRVKKEYHSHWNNLIDNFNYSTEEFYLRFKKELLSHGVSGISTRDVSLFEGNVLSSRRRYIRVIWKDYQYDICAAPFGEGFFISWWLLHRTSILEILLSRIPYIGAWLIRRIYPVTYYRIDTASMFMTYCQSSVLKVIDDITDNSGVRSLTENERKPILNDVFKR